MNWVIKCSEAAGSLAVSGDISIVPELRQVIVHGGFRSQWQQIPAFCPVLATVTLLMVVHLWRRDSFAVVNPPGQLLRRTPQP